MSNFKRFLLEPNKFSFLFYGNLIIIIGLMFAASLSLRLANARLGFFLLAVNVVLIILAVFIIVLMFFQLFQPMQRLLRETEETLQGLREGGISMVRDDEIGVLANHFNQIILDAQMKRMELETSNLELASHAEIIEKTYRELDKKVYDLFTLFNIGKELNSTLSVDTILKITCFTSMGQLGITVMSIMLLEEHEGKMVTVYCKGLRKDPERPESFVVGEGFLNLLRLHEQPILLESLEEKPEFESEYRIFSSYKTNLIAPLTAKDQVIGLLLLGKKLSGEDFHQSEKDFLTTLTSLSALALRNARHYEQAITDAMTKLYLKRYFQIRLDDETKRAARYHSKITLVMLDIDHFKLINDTYGHTRGDDVLIQVAKAIRDNFRDVDVPARYGGEEFSVIMPEVGKKDALIAAERLRKSVEKIPFVLNSQNVTVTISLGLAEFPGDAATPLALVEAADTALYRSKENGRNQSTLF